MPETKDRYICRVQDCKEDLTEKVLAKRGSGPNAGAEITTGSVVARVEIKNRDSWRVTVTCSKGHQNVFHGKF